MVLLLKIIFVVSVLFSLCLCALLFIDALWSPAEGGVGGGWPLGSRLWCLVVKLSLSHWCAGVVLDCMDS